MEPAATSFGPLTEPATASNESQLREIAVIAFPVFYSNYMVALLIPALSREFSVLANRLGWLVPGFLIPYGISTLVYGALSDWWRRAPVLAALLCLATAQSVSSCAREVGSNSLEQVFNRLQRDQAVIAHETLFRSGANRKRPLQNAYG